MRHWKSMITNSNFLHPLSAQLWELRPLNKKLSVKEKNLFSHQTYLLQEEQFSWTSLNNYKFISLQFFIILEDNFIQNIRIHYKFAQEEDGNFIYYEGQVNSFLLTVSQVPMLTVHSGRQGER